MVKQTSKLSDQTSEPSEHNTRLICPIRVTRPSRAYRQPPVPQPAPDKPPLTPRPARRLLLGPAALIAALDPAAHLPRCTLSHTHKHARARTIQQRTCRDVPPLTHSLSLSLSLSHSRTISSAPAAMPRHDLRVCPAPYPGIRPWAGPWASRPLIRPACQAYTIPWPGTARPVYGPTRTRLGCRAHPSPTGACGLPRAAGGARARPWRAGWRRLVACLRGPGRSVTTQMPAGPAPAGAPRA
jgi:hypothetical protein